MGYFPVYLELKNKRCTVIGGGKEAYEKAKAFAEKEAEVRIITDEEVLPEIENLSCLHNVELHKRKVTKTDLDDNFLVTVAAEDNSLNEKIYNYVNSQSKLVNCVDNTPNCNYIFCAITKVGSMQVAVSSSGKSPALAQKYRDTFGERLEEDSADSLADFLDSWRPAVKETFGTFDERAKFWREVVHSKIPKLVRKGKIEKANRKIRELCQEKF